MRGMLRDTPICFSGSQLERRRGVLPGGEAQRGCPVAPLDRIRLSSSPEFVWSQVVGEYRGESGARRRRHVAREAVADDRSCRSQMAARRVERLALHELHCAGGRLPTPLPKVLANPTKSFPIHVFRVIRGPLKSNRWIARVTRVC